MNAIRMFASLFLLPMIIASSGCLLGSPEWVIGEDADLTDDADEDSSPINDADDSVDDADSEFEPDVESDIEEPISYCDENGFATGTDDVYIGPEGCSEVTLVLFDGSGSDGQKTWLLEVNWPMHGAGHALNLQNLTVFGIQNEIFYRGDPTFNLYAGEYYLFGFHVAEGANVIRYRIYDFVKDSEGNSKEIDIETGTFDLFVTLVDE